MNNEKHKIPYAKFQEVRRAVLEKYGCAEKGYVDNEYNPTLDMMTLVGRETAAGIITEEDAAVLQKIYDGPVYSDGKKMPKCARWNPANPIWAKEMGFGQIHIEDDGTPINDRLYVVRQVMSWVTQKPDIQINDITYEDLDWIYDNGEGIFRFFDGQDIDLRDFRDAGNKVIYHMASGDGNVPSLSSERYYHEMVKYYGEEELHRFFRFYYTYGGAHTALTDGVYGEQVNLGECFKALMLWREDGIAPGDMPTVKWDQERHMIVDGKPQKMYMSGSSDKS